MELTEKRQIFGSLQWNDLLKRTDIMAAVGMVSILMIMIIRIEKIGRAHV